MDLNAQRARCVNCRTDISVPNSYAHGDHIKCGSCGTKHKVVRGDMLRLVIADIAPLKEALASNQAMVERLEGELRTARTSLGIGLNGIGFGLAYLLWQVGTQDRLLGTELLIEAGLTALASAIVLELANFLFLGKRRRIRRLASEIAEARQDGRQLEQKIREASRV